MPTAAPRSNIIQATKPSSAMPSRSAMRIWSPATFVQAKCACGGPTAANDEPCATCAADGELQIQPATVPGHEFARMHVQPAGELGGAALSRSADPLELEADRIADSVVHQLATPAVAGAPPAVRAVSSAAANPLQRQADPDEAAAERAADAAMEEPELESAPPADESDSDQGDEGEEESEGESEAEEEPVQAKSERDGVGPILSSTFRHGVAGARGNGAALPPGLRSGMERAFGADFSTVRIHADAHADTLARSIHALAFTTGRDIFFAAGRYDTASQAGRRLLAHELTHVLQQGAAPGRSQAALGRANVAEVQRAPDPEKSKREWFGAFYYFDAQGNQIAERRVTTVEDLGIAPGYYQVKIKGAPGDKRIQITVVGVRDLSITPGSDASALAAILAKTKSAFLLVYDKSGVAKPDAPKPSATDPTGPGGKTGEKKPEAGGGGGGDKPKTEQDEPPEGKKPSDEPKGEPGTGEKDKPGGSTGTEAEEAAGGLPGEKKSGSKYGVFGLLHLPQELVGVLEGALDVLGDAAEMESMVASLRTLKELAEHRDALADLFKDPDTLLEIALGLKENAAITAIEAWALRDVKPTKTPRIKHKGVARLAAKLLSTITKLRKILKPVFKVRSAVQSALGAVGLILEAAPAIEALLDIAGDPSKIGELELQSAVDDLAVDFAAQLREKLDFAPKALKAAIEKLSEDDLVSYEELAAAVTAAVLNSLPKTYKPFVKVGKAFGIDTAISDNFIAPLIPKAALDGVNDVLRSLVKVAQPTLESAADDLQKIVDDLAVGFLAELPAEVKKLIKPSRRAGGPARRSSAMALARRIRQSQGEPLPEPAQSDAETRMGYSFAHVRVHTDAAANQAADRINANAFAIGSNLYFGRGAFDPASDAGRRLLYHELAHSLQQEASGGVALQPDYKDLLKRLAKRFSASVMKELKGLTAPSPAMEKQATAIRDLVEKLVSPARKVVSRTNPKLPTGYMYIPKDKGKIREIRRSVKWIKYIPALTIDKKRYIRLTATLSRFDPKAAARRALRAALGCTSKQEAHHIIPLELFLKHPVVTAAIKNRFAFNGKDNGVCISNLVHSGSHDNYTKDVRRRLDALLTKYGNNWAQLQQPFQDEVNDLRSELKKRRKKLS